MPLVCGPCPENPLLCETLRNDVGTKPGGRLGRFLFIFVCSGAGEREEASKRWRGGGVGVNLNWRERHVIRGEGVGAFKGAAGMSAGRGGGQIFLLRGRNSH